jgi:hypothetical protein
MSPAWGGKRGVNKRPAGRGSRQQAGGKSLSQAGYRGRKAWAMRARASRQIVAA